MSYVSQSDNIPLQFDIIPQQQLGITRNPVTLPVSPDCPSSTEQTFDLPQLLDRCMGQLEFAETCLTRFRQRLVADVEQLQQFVNAGNTLEAARLAHLIRGSAATIAANALAAKAAALENTARSDSIDDPRLQIATKDLLNEVDRFIAVAADFRQLGSQAR